VAEHPDSLWQPFPEEVARRQARRPERASSSTGDRVRRHAWRAGRAIRILEKRFARGEIDTRELEVGRATLRGGSA
jgi:hypothetical protein